MPRRHAPIAAKHPVGRPPKATEQPKVEAKARAVHEMLDEHHRAAKPLRMPYPESVDGTLSVGQGRVSPEQAAVLRKTCHYDRQRSLRPEHILRLASEMEKGYFLAGTPIWMCVMPDKSMYIVNGNHTLEAVIRSGVEIPLTFVYQQVKSFAEIAQVYACFDIQRMRTWMQAASAAGLDEEIPLARFVLAALTHIIGDFTPNQNNPNLRSRPLRFRLMEEYKQAASMLQACLHGAPTENARMIRRSGPMAVALVTMRYQPSTAEDFWRSMVWDDGLWKDDPRKVLLRYLSSHYTTGTQATRENISAAANAWNAAFENRTIDHLKPGLSPRIQILGTPWASGPPVIKRPQRTGGMQSGRRVTGTGAAESVTTFVE